jgi:hypothetical protein
MKRQTINSSQRNNKWKKRYDRLTMMYGNAKNARQRKSGFILTNILNIPRVRNAIPGRIIWLDEVRLSALPTPPVAKAKRLITASSVDTLTNQPIAFHNLLPVHLQAAVHLAVAARDLREEVGVVEVQVAVVQAAVGKLKKNTYQVY